MANKRKLIISDLDGTLLNNDGELTEETCKIVKEISAQGNLFCIATGRPKRGAIGFYKKLELNTIMCNFNGAYINNPNDEQFLPLNFTFSRDIVAEIFSNKTIVENIENAVVETIEKTYILNKPKNTEDYKSMMKQFHIEDNIKLYLLKKIENIDHDPNSILLLLSETKNNIRIIRQEIHRISKTLVIREWSNPTSKLFAVEINSIFASKGMALKFLSAYYNVPLESVYAFGDGMNDMEMLAKAGESYAMNNSNSSLKSIARYETEFDCSHEGVSFELKRIFDIADKK